MNLHREPDVFTSKNRYELLPVISHPEDIFRVGKKVEFRKVHSVELSSTHTTWKTLVVSALETHGNALERWHSANSVM